VPSSKVVGEARGTQFEEVFARLFDRAYGVAYRILGHPQEAEDAAAEAFARAHADWSRVGELAHVDAWVLRVASNVAIDVVRRRRRRAVDSLTAIADAAVVGNDPEAAVDHVLLVAALIRLPRRQREVLVLRYLGDLREADVAECLGCSVGTVKAHAHRGLATLRESLHPSGLSAAGWT
jgi:RNA polymerase sigma-70 factor (sigma-E family)